MEARCSTIIHDLLVEHFEELEFLWGQRYSIVRSPSLSCRGRLELEERIEAHVEGLLVAGEDMISVVKNGLVSEDAQVCFAAAYALLRLEMPAAATLASEAFRQAQEGQLEGIRQALCHGPIGLVLENVRQAAAQAPPPIAVAAIEALAFHSRLGSEADRLKQFLSDENPRVRQAAWRINGEVDFVRHHSFFEAGFNDKDGQVRGEALQSAGWTRQNFLLPYCRSAAAKPALENWEGLQLLAILGKTEDLQRIMAFGRLPELGPRRFQLLGSYGHPEVVEELILGMAGTDLRSAVAAGTAFLKITGCDVESDMRVQLPPEDGHEPDEFEKEFLDEAKLPDIQKARNHWNKVKPQLSSLTRVGRGFDLGKVTGPEILDQLDMESRWEFCLRGKYDGTWSGRPFDLEKLSQPGTSGGLRR